MFLRLNIGGQNPYTFYQRLHQFPFSLLWTSRDSKLPDCLNRDQEFAVSIQFFQDVCWYLVIHRVLFCVERWVKWTAVWLNAPLFGALSYQFTEKILCYIKCEFCLLSWTCVMYLLCYLIFKQMLYALLFIIELPTWIPMGLLWVYNVIIRADELLLYYICNHSNRSCYYYIS